MNQLMLDDSLAIREVLDDIIGMVDRREKLIDSVSQQAEEKNDERMKSHVKQLEKLMSDFLSLFEPILGKVQSYATSLKESMSESEAFLKSLVGIIDAGKAIEGTSATLQELEKDADDVQEELRESTETLDKIADLFKKTRVYEHKESKGESSESSFTQAPTQPSRALQGIVAQPSRYRSIGRSRLSSNESSKSQH